MRILVADDHGLYRKGLRDALEAALPDAKILEADTAAAAFTELKFRVRFDLVLLDLNLPDRGTLDDLRSTRQSFPNTRFAILSNSDTRTDILNGLAAGFHGFISKSQSNEEIIDAVKGILAGRIYVSSKLAKMGDVCEPATPRETDTRTLTQHRTRIARLTPRQRDVLGLLARGMSNKEIARVLHIAEATTKVHAAGLLQVLGVRNRVEAAVIAQALGTVAIGKREDWAMELPLGRINPPRAPLV